jgi:hypothetical protein
MESTFLQSEHEIVSIDTIMMDCGFIIGYYSNKNFQIFNLQIDIIEAAIEAKNLFQVEIEGIVRLIKFLTVDVCVLTVESEDHRLMMFEKTDVLVIN